MAGACENSNELRGCIQCGELLDWLRNCKFHKKIFCFVDLVS